MKVDTCTLAKQMADSIRIEAVYCLFLCNLDLVSGGQLGDLLVSDRNLNCHALRDMGWVLLDSQN